MENFFSKEKSEDTIDSENSSNEIKPTEESIKKPEEKYIPQTEFEKELHKGIEVISKSFSNKEESKFFIDSIFRDKENQSKQKVEMFEEKMNDLKQKIQEEKENMKSIKEMKKYY